VVEQFPLTSLWRAASARFMPPVPEVQLPGELIARFTGPAHEALMRLLVWLSPLTARSVFPVRSSFTRAVEHPQKLHVAAARRGLIALASASRTAGVAASGALH
jgi:hypothetical protein